MAGVIRKGSFVLKEIIVHVHCSVRYFPFHGRQGAVIFTALEYK